MPYIGKIIIVLTIKSYPNIVYSGFCALRCYFCIKSYYFCRISVFFRINIKSNIEITASVIISIIQYDTH